LKNRRYKHLASCIDMTEDG